jgi:hypothetical protein
MKKLYTKKSSINGTGLYTKDTISQGEHIAFITGKVRSKVIANKHDALTIPTWYGITESQWIDPTGTIWSYFNHSCEPNSAIIGTKKLIALTTIEPETELTIDYSMTDGDIHWELEYTCNCGSKNCRKKIHPIQRISDDVFNKHMPFIPKYFVQLRKKYLRSGKIN